MKTLFIIIFLLNISIYLCQAKTSSLLKGKIISSDESSETISYAFDGNSETEFQSTKKSTIGWVGLELEVPNRITKIGWMQKENDPKKYLLGVFEGANEESFINAFPLYMITEEGKPNQMNYIDIDVTYAFKYVRYVGINGTNSVIAGLEFYGYESSTNISKEEEKLYQPTNLPLVVIHTENSEEPKDKVNDINCNIVIIDKNKVDTKKKATITLRGNSTKKLDKRPYKFKFEDKATILDFHAKAKKWSLLANHIDKTLLRNTLALKLSEFFNMKYSPQCRHVDLIFNGEFRGNYALCDKIEVAKGRIEFPEEETQNEIKGFFLEVNTQSKGNTIRTTKGIPYSIHYPSEDEITQEQREYIENEMNIIEAEGYDGVLDKIDYESLCQYVLVGELGSDPDIFYTTYLTKNLVDDKLYFGPVWDFDLGFGNDMRTYSKVHNDSLLLKFGMPSGTMKDFVVKILNNEKVLDNLKQMWKKTTESKMTKKNLIDFFDSQVKNIYESQKLNFKRWDILDKRLFTNAVAKCTYDAEVDFLREYLDVRFDIIGKILDRVDTSTINEETQSSFGWGDWGGNGGNWGGNGGNWGGFGNGNNGNWGGNFNGNGNNDWPQNPDWGQGGNWGGMGGMGAPQVEQSCLNKTSN